MHFSSSELALGFSGSRYRRRLAVYPRNPRRETIDPAAEPLRDFRHVYPVERRMEDGFNRVDADMRDLRSEMETLFERVETASTTSIHDAAPWWRRHRSPCGRLRRPDRHSAAIADGGAR
jgi:hypothetical protein